MTAPSAAHAAPPVQETGATLSTRVSGAVLLLFLAVGLVSTVFAVATQRLDLLPHALTRKAFLDGASMRDMAAALANAPQAKTAADLEREASWLTTRDLGPQVRQGCEGWLFLAEELAPHPGGDEHLAGRAKLVADMQAALQKRGIRLLVAMVPDKSRIEHQRLCGLRRPAAFDGRLSGWITRLQAAGVPVVDTGAALQALLDKGQDPFFRTDTHWTETGADAAAHAVADGVRAMSGQPQPVQDFDITHAAPTRRPGDLVRLAGIDRLPAGLQPAGEEAVSSSFAQRKGAETQPAGGEADLFGDADLPTVTLIGTSFSRTSHFAEFLAAALRSPVGNFGKDGGNFWGSAGAYFAGEAFRDTPPKVVVWEIPERTLQLPIAGEKWAVP